MLDLLKKIIALVPVGHELYNAIADLLKELCSRVSAYDDQAKEINLRLTQAENGSRETREMFAARADQVAELTTRLAQLETSDRIPQLASEIKDVRIDALESIVASLKRQVDDFDPEVKFVRAELPDSPPPPVLARNDAPDGPPAASPPAGQCPKHPDAPATENGCTAEGCIWPGIDSAA